MKFKVIKSFRDLQDKGHVYGIGDEFPREGVEVADKRVKELASAKNKVGVPLIKKVEPKPEPEPKKKK